MAQSLNVRVIFDGTPAAIRNLKGGMAKLVATAAHDVEAVAKVRAPVDTGMLRASIQAFRRSELTWLVLVGAEHGIYQEFGTRYMAAQPFLIPSVEAVRHRLKFLAMQLLK